jgi:hypothetical protein
MKKKTITRTPRAGGGRVKKDDTDMIGSPTYRQSFVYAFSLTCSLNFGADYTSTSLITSQMKPFKMKSIRV